VNAATKVAVAVNSATSAAMTHREAAARLDHLA